MNILNRSSVILVIITLKLLVTSEDLSKCIPEAIQGECKEYYEYTASLEDNTYSQSNLDSLIHLYDELLNIPCSNYFKLFLCLKYKPPCLKTKANNFIFGNLCRSMCEHVYDMCYPYLKLRNNDLNCTSFKSTDGCIYEKGFPKDSGIKYYKKPEKTYPFDEKFNLKYICFYLNDFKSQMNYKCVPRCEIHTSWFNQIEKQFSFLFLIILSLMCLFLWLFTLTLFIKCKNNLFHSELCLIFITISFIIYSFVYIISLQLNNELIGCQSIFVDIKEIGSIPSLEFQNPQNLSKISISNVNDNIYSIIIFIILNYTRIAVVMWWLILTYYLFSNNETNSKYIMIFGWLFPAIHTMIAKKYANISEISIYSIEIQDSKLLLLFNILPNVLMIILGIIFTLLSVYKPRIDIELNNNQCKCEIRNKILRKQCVQNLKLLYIFHQKQADLIVFCFIFIIPIIISTCCEIYQYLKNMDSWFYSNQLIELKDPFNSSIRLHTQNILSGTSHSKEYKLLDKIEIVNDINTFLIIIKHFMIYLSGFSLIFYYFFDHNFRKYFMTKLKKLYNCKLQKQIGE